MTFFAVIRHGPTRWSEDGLLQVRTDIPLSDAWRRLVKSWRIPDQLADFQWISSPLKRAVETATLISDRDVGLDPRLVEMNWAVWEGRRLVDLRAELGENMKHLEGLGLDFCPPGGESPRDVQNRLGGVLLDCCRAGRPTVAVCHKGIIRALYASATNWDMLGKAPHKLKANCALLFVVREDGPTIENLNLPLLDEN